jgi:signal transduction histidine kinase
MRRRRLTGLRARLLIATGVCALLAVAALVAIFNLVLDAQLRGAVDSVLRERAAAQLRTLSIVDGRLQVPEAPDQASRDAQTWIFAANRVYEQPNNAGPNDRAAFGLAHAADTYVTVPATKTRLHAVPIVAGARRQGTLVVGSSLLPYQRSARTAWIASLVLGALIVLGVALLAAWLVGRALAPVARMAADAAGWPEHEPMGRFFPGEPHDELTALAATFDRLLSRLSASLEREQRFTAEISHELRTPLAAIVAEAELALARNSTPQGYRSTLRTILSSAENLGAALDALLSAARAESTAATHPTAARTVLDAAAQHARQAGAGAGVRVDVAIVNDPLRIAAEAQLAERALLPLVENAVRFARGRVQIAARAEDGAVVFEVNDDGPGVQEAMREQIFQPGVSSPVSTANGGSGAGLGLALARRLARAAGGEVQCVPSPTGARFRLRLPAG